MERKLVSVQTITDIRPINGADRIEVARVLGWNVVVGKNEFSVNQKIAYFEVDSFLRGDKDIFEPFLKRGTKKFIIDGSEIEGHVTPDARDEGVVFHPVDPEDITGKLATVIDRNGNFKVISSGYLLKHKI